ncbi:hypothetical protein [Desulfosporosinus sp. BG]|uniref:hypothetical protein n=1 Tax=Desulfosporosinus sp. BG TaxID=1633135 RepID=UPI00114CABD3|nr:hypothetical protein [Desulfosporosinus sp. BG]
MGIVLKGLVIGGRKSKMFGEIVKDHYLLIIGFLPIIITGFMSGAFVSGDRVRGKSHPILDGVKRR